MSRSVMRSDWRELGIVRCVLAKNLEVLRAVCEAADRRVCDAEPLTLKSLLTWRRADKVSRPSSNEGGLYAAGLRFGDPPVVAMRATVVGFCHLIEFFTAGQVVGRVYTLRSLCHTSREATCDLRRLEHTR